MIGVAWGVEHSMAKFRLDGVGWCCHSLFFAVLLLYVSLLRGHLAIYPRCLIERARSLI